MSGHPTGRGRPPIQRKFYDEENFELIKIENSKRNAALCNNCGDILKNTTISRLKKHRYCILL